MYNGLRMSRCTLLITAGPTREPIDPVRYLTNRSSGKMGYALAADAVQRGWRVILISGPTRLDVPEGVDFIPVETADQMYEAVERFCGRADAAILCAAVADYKPAQALERKMKKSAERLTIELVRTRDILGSMRNVFGFKGLLVGFAAETHDVRAYAEDKLERKGCDLIVANDVSRPGIGFDSDENEVTLVYKGGCEVIPRGSKCEIAGLIMDYVDELSRHQEEGCSDEGCCNEGCPDEQCCNEGCSDEGC